MLQSLWMRPALQKGEAVMMPALLRGRMGETWFSAPVYSDLYDARRPKESDFLPIPAEQPEQTMALSTYVRPRGSIAGRSVLRAAGVSASPYGRMNKPTYYHGRSQRRPLGLRFG